MNSLFWHKLRNQGAVPSPREGLSFLYSAHMEKWILFGGTGDRRFSEVFTYDPQSGSWELLQAEGHVPRGRGYQVSWIDEDSNTFFIHGGQGDKRDSLGDMFALDLDHFVWKKLYIIDQPTGRAHHAACKQSAKIFLYGGSSAPENLLLDDLWSFSYRDIDWSASGTEVPAPGWVSHKYRGVTPGPRKGHTLCSFQDSVVLFGGVTNQKYTSDLFILNVNDMRWMKAQPRGKGPSSRAFHAMAVLDSFCVAIFGGVESLKEGRAERLNILNDFYILDLGEMHWSVPIMGGYCPSRRYGHAMCWGTDASGKDQLLLLGGLEQTYCQIEVYSLSKSDLAPGQAWQISSSQREDKNMINKAENALKDQNRKIKDLQNQLSINRDRIVILENEKETLEERLEQEYRRAHDEHQTLNQRIIQLEREVKIKDSEMMNVIQSNQVRQDKNDLLNERIEKLEDLIKKAESLLITLDHSFNEIVNNNNPRQLRGFSQERVDEITERRKKHHESLLALRQFYERNIEEIDNVPDKSQDSLQDSLDES